jgi:hypothetical protein
MVASHAIPMKVQPSASPSLPIIAIIGEDDAAVVNYLAATY